MAITETEIEVKEGDVRIRVIRDDHPESPRDWDNLGTMTCWHSRYNLGDEEPKFKRQIQLFLSLLDGAPDKLMRSLIVKLVRSNHHIWNDYKAEVHCYPRGERPDLFQDFVENQLGGDDTAEQIQDVGEAASKMAVVLPLFLMDHSGLSISTSSAHFRACDSAGWDWGQVGFIWVTHENVKKEYGEVNDETIKKAEACLESEVETYDHYLQGDIYGYVLEKAEIFTHGEGDEQKTHVEWEHEDSCWGFYGTEFDTNGMKDNIPEEQHAALRKALESPEY